MQTRLSILDIGTVDRGGSVADTVATSVAVAQRAEELGYHRIWYAEHHNLPGGASSLPAVLISHVGARTRSIRLGSGGVMLPNYAPLTIAEQFGMLEAMHPGRIDLGLGRASGSDPAATRAIRRAQVAAADFPDDVRELQGYLAGHSIVPGVAAVPGNGSNVPLYILGSSLFGAQLAASLGLPFAFGSHFAPATLEQALDVYRTRFRPSAHLERPYTLATASVIIADTAAEAQQQLTDVRRMLATTLFGRQLGVTSLSATEAQADELLARGAAMQADQTLTYLAIGTAREAADYLASFARRIEVDEVMTLHQAQRSQLRLRSVTELGEAFSAASPGN